MKALVLAYDFPPRVAVGGMRPYSWYRYWAELGISPVVVTRQWSNGRGYELDYVSASPSPAVLVERTEFGTIIRTPYRPNLSNRLLIKHGRERYRLIRRALTGLSEVGQFYWHLGPRRNLYTAARRYLREHGADVVVATGEPFVLFRYAHRLSEEFGVPWIADYRDPWSDAAARPGRRFLRRWEAWIERRVAGTASAITTPSDLWAALIGAAAQNKPIHVIPNGYDPEALATASAEPQGDEKLTLAYVGSIYPFYPLESFLRACETFVRGQERARFELLFVGVANQTAVEELVAQRFAALAPYTTFRLPMPNAEMAHLLARANAFVAFNNYGFPGTKIYDYLALKRRVLLCYSADREALELKARLYGYDDDVSEPRIMERIVAETRAGTVVRDAEHLGAVLAELYAEFLQTGRVACESHGVERFSRRTQAGRMANVLRQVTAAG